MRSLKYYDLTRAMHAFAMFWQDALTAEFDLRMSRLLEGSMVISGCEGVRPDFMTFMAHSEEL